MLYGAKEIAKDFICFKEIIYFSPQKEIKTLFWQNVFQSNNFTSRKVRQAKWEITLPTYLNETILVSPWTYSRLKSTFLQTQESNSQMVNATWCSLFHQVLSKLFRLENHYSVTIIKNVLEGCCCCFLFLFFFIIFGILLEKKLNVHKATQGVNITIRTLK